MRFQYDPAKAAANLKKHGVSFADAEGVLADPLAVTVENPDAEVSNASSGSVLE
ncbi:MAG: BrnT family toxin, partial [Pyrinomonadaceae bacterium]